MKKEKRSILKKHGYSFTGRESGVKLCHWVSNKLINNRSCYKEDFYGIQCHRCLQMSPVLDLCNQRCLFCWRYQDHEERNSLDFDDPKKIVENSIEAQRDLVSGFKGDERCSEEMWKEARDPNQVAISLSGEPTLYPYLGELIKEYKKRGMTTFLVTNGTLPERLETLSELPTQLYVTLSAPTRKIYNRLCVPDSEDNWDKIQQTIDVLSSLDTRTVIRHTLVKGWNIGWEKEYVEMIERADPDFVEAKGYVFVGDSRRRMNLDNMPSHEMIRDFGKKEARLLGWDVLKEKKDSRVVLLGENGTESKLR
ncbi:MAG: 4-demethylwyosine synthase TYW1 [Candidatus Saliniplasma sp.]